MDGCRMKATSMRRVLFYIIVLLSLAGCHRKPSDFREILRNGDLLFVSSGSSEGMDGAISSATGNDEGLSFVHIAMAEVEGDSIRIIEATPKRGVDRHSYDIFLQESMNKDGEVPTIRVMRVGSREIADRAVRNARELCGCGYDLTFLPDNDSYYCSELVYVTFKDKDGLPVFEASPMNFKSADGTFPDYWTDLFNKLEMPVPQGVPGTNPQDMSASPLLHTVITVPSFTYQPGS